MDRLSEATEQLRRGQHQDAVARLEELLKGEPTNARAWFLLGACHHAMGALGAAGGAFSRSVALDPANPEPHLAYIAVLRAAGSPNGALTASQQAQLRIPGNARVMHATALCYEDLGQDDSALAHYETALDLSPTLEDALHNRGLLLARVGRLEDAESNHRRYVASHPGSARALSTLGDFLLALCKYADAADTFWALTRISQEDISAQVRYGISLASLGRLSDARVALDHLRTKDPHRLGKYLEQVAPGSVAEVLLSPETIFLSRAWAALGACDWSTWHSFVEVLKGAVSDTDIQLEPAVAFMCQHAPLSGQERHAIARRISSRIEDHTLTFPPPPPASSPRIRLGLLSADFREHLDAYAALPIIQLLDRSSFDVYAYSLSADDGSPIRAQIQHAADKFSDLNAMSDVEAAAAIRRDDIDILLDLTGFKAGGRFGICARRPARSHVSFRGFSASMGSRRVDYAIVDRIVGADDEEWSEARIFVPAPYYLYDFRAEASHEAVTRREYGLPEDGVVLCAFHKAFKITPDAFALWMDILSKVPNAVLWFRDLPDKAVGRLREQAHGHGVNAARLIFAPYESRTQARYFARHRLGDLMLDALHHNAVESACDALGEGLPVVTLRGSAMASRVGACLLTAAGLPDLIASTPQEYVELATTIAQDRNAISRLKKQLLDNRESAPLFDTTSSVQRLESVFKRIVERMKSGHPPTTFDL